MPFTILDNPGSSGALLFFTHDRKYIVKTKVKKTEKEALIQRLPELVKYLKGHSQSLFIPFLGLFDYLV